MTFLFTDIEGSTALWEQHPEGMRVALAEHDRLLKSAISRHRGWVFASGGDGFAVAFSSPLDAARAALDAQAAMGSAEWPKGLVLRVRIGMHTGTAEERDGDYFGPTLNRAARVMAVARGGEIVASAATAGLLGELAREGVELVDLGRHELRGVGIEQLAGLVPAGGAFRAISGVEPAVRLPAAGTSFIGRELELIELAAALEGSRLVTLVGPGGVGKTRLATEVGRAVRAHHRHGVWMVELAAVREPDALWHALVAALEVRPLPGRTPAEAIVAAVRGERRLIVLDNCEHLLDHASAATHLLLAECPDVAVLATSRAPLGLGEERVWPLAPLPPESAGVELFVERAIAADARYRLGEDRATVTALCERLDGMPLAIELAAARVRSMSPQDLLDRLADRFRLLRAPRASDERHGALEATVAWSYQLLGPTEQAVFDVLSVFAAPVDLQAVTFVADAVGLDEYDVLDAVSFLVDHSLVVAERRGAHTVYRQLETMRAYGQRQLRTAELAGPVADAHARWAAATIAELMAVVHGDDWDASLAASDDVDRFWPDLRQAVHHATTTKQTVLAMDLIGHFTLEAHLRERDELIIWAQTVMELDGWIEHPKADAVIGWCALLQWRAGDTEAGGNTLARRISAGPDPNAATSIPDGTRAFAEGLYLILEGRLEVAQESFRALVEQFRAEGSEFWADLFACAVAVVDAYGARSASAIEALDALRPFRNPVLESYRRWVLTQALVDADPHRAIAVGRSTIELSQETGATWVVDSTANYLASALAVAGTTREAVAALHAATDRMDSGGGIQSIANTVRALLILLHREQQLESAAVLAGWLAAQTRVVPGTAGMRSRVAAVASGLPGRLGADALQTALDRGAAMQPSELIAYLRRQLKLLDSTSI